MQIPLDFCVKIVTFAQKKVMANRTQSKCNNAKKAIEKKKVKVMVSPKKNGQGGQRKKGW